MDDDSLYRNVDVGLTIKKGDLIWSSLEHGFYSIYDKDYYELFLPYDSGFKYSDSYDDQQKSTILNI